nr:MAG TPA: DNA polymerase A [Caudoviricetes sp.]
MEINVECPECMVDEIASVIVQCMKSAGVYFCPNAPLSATPNIGDFWIH